MFKTFEEHKLGIDPEYIMTVDYEPGSPAHQTEHGEHVGGTVPFIQLYTTKSPPANIIRKSYDNDESARKAFRDINNYLAARNRGGKSDFQSWIQTVAVIATIIATVGFFWINVPSKDDIKLLREDMNRRFELMTSEMNRRFGEIRSDIQRLDQNYKNHLDKHSEKENVR